MQSAQEARLEDAVELAEIRARAAIKYAGGITKADGAYEIRTMAGFISEKGGIDSGWIISRHWAAIEAQRARCQH